MRPICLADGRYRFQVSENRVAILARDLRIRAEWHCGIKQPAVRKTPDMAQFIDVKGEPTRERQNLSFVLHKEHAPTGTTHMRPGPLRLMLENRTRVRTLPSVWIAGQELHDLLGRRRPFLTAKRLLTNQIFRDIYRADTMDVDQRLKITSLTFLFTDLRGSTELYDRVGDLAAFDIVRAHFQLLTDIVAQQGGAVVKTIGDAVMATFSSPERAVKAALHMGLRSVIT